MKIIHENVSLHTKYKTQKKNKRKKNRKEHVFTIYLHILLDKKWNFHVKKIK